MDNNQNNINDPLAQLLAKAKIIDENPMTPPRAQPGVDPYGKVKGPPGVGWIFLGALILIGYFILKAWVVQLLWNWFLPSFFGLPQISVVKGLVLLLLSEVLVKQTIVDLSDLSTSGGSLDFKKIQMRKAMENIGYVLVVGAIIRVILFGTL